MNKKWEYIGVDDEKVKDIAFNHNISEIIARVLLNRGICEAEEIDKFLKERFIILLFCIISVSTAKAWVVFVEL